MPIEFWPGATVPGRKRMRNPWTITGNPGWNTYEGLGIPSTAKTLNSHMSGQNRDRRKGMGLNGPRSRVKRKAPLHESNLAHRAHEVRDRANGHFEAARRLSLQIDHTCTDVLLDLYTQKIEALCDLGERGRGRIEELVRLEAARGVVRASITARRYQG